MSMDTKGNMIVKLTFAALAAMASLLAFDAAAQSQLAVRCLEAHQPVLRNADGSLSPNPAFDDCLRGRITSPPAAKPARPQHAAPSFTPAPGTPVTAPYLSPVGAVSPVPASSSVLAPVQVTPPPAKPAYVAMDKAPVQATLRTWLPADWRLAWDTKADPRGVAMESGGDFLQAVRALFSTRKDWSTPLEAVAYEEEKILQVRDPASPAPPQLTPESKPQL